MKASRSGYNWTKKELEYLEEKWGEVLKETLARKLKRTEKAIQARAEILGLGSFRQVGTIISSNQAGYMLGICSKVVVRWIDEGKLEATHKLSGDKRRWFIKHNDLISFLQNNQDIWDSRKVEEFALGREPEWLKEKRKKDMLLPIRKDKKWTKKQDEELKKYLKAGYTQEKIGKILGRSRAGVQRRVSKLKKQGKLSYTYRDLPWQDKEIEMMLKMELEGLSDEEIAWELGRELDSIRGKRIHLRELGRYNGTKNERKDRERYKKIIELRSKRKNVKEIAETLKIHETTIYRIVNRMEAI